MMIDGKRLRLAIPITDALDFALGLSDLGYVRPPEALRQLMGLFVIDALEYAEHWRVAAMTRACLESKWRDRLEL